MYAMRIFSFDTPRLLGPKSWRGPRISTRAVSRWAGTMSRRKNKDNNKGEGRMECTYRKKMEESRELGTVRSLTTHIPV
mgnify:CR=1 FL=1